MKAGWEVKPLGEVCRLINGRAYKKPELLADGKYPVLRVGNFFTNNHWYYSNLELENDKYCNDGDLLYAWSASFGPRIWQGGKVIYHYHIWKVEPLLEQLDQAYLYYFFDWDKDRIKDEQGAGATMIHVSKKSMDARAIPLPPLEEQKRIVAVLDAAFEGLTRARTHIETNLQNARELFGNLLDAVFTDCPDHWVKSNLGETCKFVGGSQPPKSNFVAEPGEGLVRLVQIRDYKSDKNVVYVPRSLVRRFCSPDDVMIGRYGPPLFQILRGIDGAYNVALMKAEPDGTKISKDFLYLFLRNSRIWRYINDASSRAAGQIGLNKATIEPYPIAYPNLEEQEAVVKRLAKAEADCKQAEALYRTKLQDLDDLRQSLLQKAFAGELT